MSVNGSGNDRRTNKPTNDQTSWSVKKIGGEIATDSKGKPLSGVTADVAFSTVRTARRNGTYLTAVRT